MRLSPGTRKSGSRRNHRMLITSCVVSNFDHTSVLYTPNGALYPEYQPEPDRTEPIPRFPSLSIMNHGCPQKFCRGWGPGGQARKCPHKLIRLIFDWELERERVGRVNYVIVMPIVCKHLGNYNTPT